MQGMYSSAETHPQAYFLFYFFNFILNAESKNMGEKLCEICKGYTSTSSGYLLNAFFLPLEFFLVGILSAWAKMD